MSKGTTSLNRPIGPTTDGTARRLTTALLAEQAFVAVIGTVGALRLDLAPMLLRFYAAAFLVLFLYLLFVVKPPIFASRLVMWACGAICLAAVAKAGTGGELRVAMFDAIRMLSPLLWAVAASRSGVLEALPLALRARQRPLSILLVLQLLLMATARLRGWGGGYLAGDPLVGVLVYPSLLRSGTLNSALSGVAAALVMLSLKRTAWLAVLAAGLIAFVALPSRRRLKLTVRAGAAVAGAFLLLAIAHQGGAIQTRFRATPLDPLSSSADPSVDASIGRRNEENRKMWEAGRESPVLTSLWGAPARQVVLSNGIRTRAIHNTYVFLLLAGGAIVLLGMLGATRSSRDPITVGLLIGAVATLVDAVGGNNALTPSLGIALAVLASAVHNRGASRVE